MSEFSGEDTEADGEVGFCRAAAKAFAQRGVDRNADRLRAHRDQRDREDARSAGAGGHRGSLLTVPAPWQCPPGIALRLAGLQPHHGDLKNPVYAGAFAYGWTSTRSRVIEGRAGKTAGNGVPMEEWVGTISFR